MGDDPTRQCSRKHQQCAAALMEDQVLTLLIHNVNPPHTLSLNAATQRHCLQMAKQWPLLIEDYRSQPLVIRQWRERSYIATGSRSMTATARRSFLSRNVSLAVEATFVDRDWCDDPALSLAEVKVIQCDVDARLATERVFQRRLAERDELKAPGSVLRPSIRGFELLSLLVPMSRVDATGSSDPLKPSASEARTGAVPHAPLARQSINSGGRCRASSGVRFRALRENPIAIAGALVRLLPDLELGDLKSRKERKKAQAPTGD
jgi:hypothetical protein